MAYTLDDTLQAFLVTLTETLYDTNVPRIILTPNSLSDEDDRIELDEFGSRRFWGRQRLEVRTWEM